MVAANPIYTQHRTVPNPVGTSCSGDKSPPRATSARVIAQPAELFYDPRWEASEFPWFVSDEDWRRLSLQTLSATPA